MVEVYKRIITVDEDVYYTMCCLDSSTLKVAQLPRLHLMITIRALSCQGSKRAERAREWSSSDGNEESCSWKDMSSAGASINCSKRGVDILIP